MNLTRAYPRRRARLAAVAIGAAAAIGGISASVVPSASAAHSGGTVTFGLQAGEPINYIFPFMTSQYVSNANLDAFQNLMFRPTYWWDGSPYKLNESKSLAEVPKFEDGDRVVVIKMKSGWRFSNGERVGVQNLAFFLNMLQAERTKFWGYLPGAFPDTLASVKYNNAAGTVTLHMKNSVNPPWFLENQLSLTTPMPLAWDLTGPGKKGKCASENSAVAAKSCPAVYKYLTSQASSTSGYARNPLWQIVDGPFRLSKFAAGGTSVTLVPNRSYSGATKPTISSLVFDVATSDAAEFNLLRSHGLTVGYVPFNSAPNKPAGASKPTINPVPGYTFEPVTATWSYNDLFWNYNNPQLGPLLHQEYFRQAMQSLMDQSGDIKAALRGYGFMDAGPNPPQPPNQFETSYEKSLPYPFSLKAAKKYLTSNGWSVSSNKVATCAHPGKGHGKCGAGITKGESMPSIKLQYSAGSQAWALEMTSLQSAASQVGIKITPVSTPESNLAQYFAGCTAKQPTCSWQMIYLGSPETDTPNFYPETGVVFRTHAIFNVSNYSNPYVESLFTKIYTKPGNRALDTLDNYLTKTAALLWAPVPSGPLYEASPSLKGFTPNPPQVLEPEDWRLG